MKQLYNCSKMIVSLVIILITFFASFSLFPIISSANEINKAYLSEEFWYSQDNIETKAFDYGDYEPSGYLRYFQDVENNMFYVSVTLSDVNDELPYGYTKLHFDIVNSANEYHFGINENGICDYEGNENDLFEIIYNFDKSYNGVYLAGIKIDNGSYINDLSFTLNFGGRNYILISNLHIDATPTTTVKETTTKDTKQTTTKHTTTKITKTSKATTKKITEAKTTTTPSTKFYAHIETSSTTKTTKFNGQANSGYSNAYERKYTLSNRAIISIVLGSILLVMALVCFILFFKGIKSSQE